MVLSTASLGAIPHLMQQKSPLAIVGAAASTTNVVLNVQAIAAVLLQDRIDAGRCACGSPGTTSLDPAEVVVHGVDECRVARRAAQ